MKKIIGIVSGAVVAIIVSLILVFYHPLSVSAVNQYMSISLSENVANAPLGYDLPLSGDIVENIDWESAVAPYAYQMTNNHYSIRVKDEFTDGRVIELSKSGYVLELQPMNLEWTNDLDQIQLISNPQNVVAQTGGIGDENWIRWEDAYGSGINFKWQTLYKELEKDIEIESFADLPPPEQYILDGGNPVLRYSLIFDCSNDLDIIVDGNVWNRSTEVQTFNDIEFQLNGETLWSFAQLEYWNSNYDEQQSIATLDKKGSSLYISILIPYSWLQTASYPVYIDADIAINTGLETAWDTIQCRSGIYWTSSTVGYVFFITSTGLQYDKTSDGGSNWAGASTIVAHDMVAMGCYADWETPGDSGTKIHIVYIDTDDDDISYCYFDTDGDSSGGDTTILSPGAAISTTVNYGYHYATITKTVGGILATAFHYRTTSVAWAFYTSDDSGSSWDSRASPWESVEEDKIVLYPANLADTDDLWGLYVDFDGLGSAASIKTFDDSGNSWSEDHITSIYNDEEALPFAADVRHSDGHLMMALWNIYDSASADLLFYDIEDGSNITSKTTILTDTGEAFLADVFINQVNNYIYVSYAKGTSAHSAVKIYYQYSDDGATSWEGETAMQADAEDDERWVCTGGMAAAQGAKFMPVWFNDDLDDLFCNADNAISIAASGGYGISNTPSTWTLNGITGDGTIEPDTVYYSNPNGDTTTPNSTVVDGDCRFTVTNDGSIAVDLTVTISDFSGGDANMTNGNTGNNGATSYGAYAWYSGMTYSSKVIAKSSGSSILYSNLAASATLKWGAEIETQTNAWNGGSSSTATMTITATEH